MKSMKSIILVTILSLVSSLAFADQLHLEIAEKQMELADKVAQAYISDDYVCVYTQDEVFKHFQRAVDYLEYNTQIPTTKNLDEALKNSFGYKALLAPNYRDLNYIREVILPGTVMFGPSPGAYGPSSTLEFKTSSTLTFSELIFDDNPDLDYKWVHTDFNYSVSESKNGEVVISYVNSKKEIIEFEVRQPWFQVNEWHLLPLGVDGVNPYFDGYVDFGSECEA